MARCVRAAALAALVNIACQAAAPAQDGVVPLSIAADTATHVFQVEIADEPRERATGLMYRRDMAEDHGMLFDFGADLPASFWMRNTYIPLDIVFIRGDGTIESIAERTTPLSERSVRSKGPVRYVLEINGGLSDALGIEPGDIVSGPAMELAE